MKIISGGANGTDTLVELNGKQYNHQLEVISFEGHQCKSENRIILSQEYLKSVDNILKMYAKILRRHYPTNNEYINNLLRRDYYIYGNAEIMIAFGYLDLTTHQVEGGTGWGVEFAKFNIPVYVFNLYDLQWYEFNREKNFILLDDEVILQDKRVAIIGTRRLSKYLDRVAFEINLICRENKLTKTKPL